MLLLKVLVYTMLEAPLLQWCTCTFEFLAVNAFSTCSVAVGEVPALAHKLGDDAVEDAALVVKRLPRRAHTLLARAQGAEIL